jgi:hypothetical protein
VKIAEILRLIDNLSCVCFFELKSFNSSEKVITLRGFIMSGSDSKFSSKFLTKVLTEACPGSNIADVQVLDTSLKKGLYNATIRVRFKGKTMPIPSKELPSDTWQLQFNSLNNKFSLFEFKKVSGEVIRQLCKDPWDPPDEETAEEFTKGIIAYSRRKQVEKP